MQEFETFDEFKKYCPFTCPFLRKKKDGYIFLCRVHNSILVNDKNFLPLRHQECGAEVTESAFNTFMQAFLKAKKDMPRIMDDETHLIENIFMALSPSEQMLMSAILKNEALCESFLKSLFDQPQDADLLKDTRALLNEYEKEEELEETKEMLKRQQLLHMNNMKSR